MLSMIALFKGEVSEGVLQRKGGMAILKMPRQWALLYAPVCQIYGMERMAVGALRPENFSTASRRAKGSVCHFGQCCA